MAVTQKSIHRNKPLHEQTYKALRSAILSGELAPGDRLVETELASKFRVSRTPIREAIRKLQCECLVTSDSNGGSRVATISVIDAIKLFDCRIALEVLAAREACDHVTPLQLENLKLLLRQTEALIEQGEFEAHSPQLLDLNSRFHQLVAKSSGNNWLVFLLDQVFGKTALLRVQTLRVGAEAIQSHVEH